MRTTLMVVRALVALLLGLVALFGAIDTVHGFVIAPKIDPADRCRPAEAGKCFRRVRGVVREGGSFYELKASYDDGRRTEGLFMLDASPEPGTRVWLEWWDDEVVALYDSSTETRFRTRDWPLRWDWAGIVITVLCLGLGAALWPWRWKLVDEPAERPGQGV